MTIILSEGVYALTETTSLKPERRSFSRIDRLTMRAEVLPEDPEWDIGRMPTLIHTMAIPATWNGPGPDRLGGAVNAFGGAMVLALATERPDRVRKMVLMGSVGIEFELTPGLDVVWGYEPTIAYMRKLLDIFAFNRALVTDELAELRHRAATRPGVAYRLFGLLPRAELHAFGHCGHWVQIEHKDAFNCIVDDFLPSRIPVKRTRSCVGRD